MARYLYIVSQQHPALYEYLVERFAGDDNARVILDRRLGRLSRGDEPASAPERRGRDEVDAEIRAHSFAIVDLAP